MPSDVLIVSATTAESDILRTIPGIFINGDTYFHGRTRLHNLVTGVGSVATAWSMTKFLSSGIKPDLAVNIGIAGSFSNEISVGEVVLPVSDCFADAGIDTGNSFLTLWEAGLENPDSSPFRSGRIIADNMYVSKAKELLRAVSAVTLNTASGSAEKISMLKERFGADIETMEGAAFFYVCSKENIPFMSLRAVSNMVEPRNRERWNIPLALKNLSEILKEIFLILE